MASSKRGAPAPMGLSPRGVPHSGFLVFSEVRGSKLDCNAEKKAAFEDDEILKKEVKAYNKSIVEKRTIRYENLLDMSRMDPIKSTRARWHSGRQSTRALWQAGGLEAEHSWDTPVPFWWSFCSEELVAIHKIAEGSFSIDIMEVKELMRRISERTSQGVTYSQEDTSIRRNVVPSRYHELGLNAHLSDEYEKMQALIQPKGDVEVYVRMRLFQGVANNAVKVQEALIEDERTAEL